MPRRQIEITITRTDDKENRDEGKTFVLKEASAVQTEEWGLRAMMALGTAGLTVPKEIVSAGLFGFMLIGYQALMGAREQSVLPLWREMLTDCVSIKHSDAVSLQPFGKGEQVEEVSTLLLLRQKILELHTGFTIAELGLKYLTTTSAMTPEQSNTPTSPEPSEQ